MDTDETSLEIFLRDRMKEKGISLKKLSDLTGISTNHIENMLRGDFERVPSTPYFRGYLIRLGETLNFDGEAWWEKIKKEEGVRKSGPADALPRNRFARGSPAKAVAISAAILALLIVLGFALPHIFGKPAISITSPQGNPSVSVLDNVTIQGTVKNADSLYVDGDEATIANNGSWQKTVLLQSGVNTFDISAKKFLGGTTNVMEQITYNPTATSTVQSSSPSSTPSSTKPAAQ
jgi:cytoskeletal protein RodZ